jgi:hypothetical protein
MFSLPGCSRGTARERKQRKEPSMTIHPKAKRWVAVEFIGFPIVVSVLLNMLAGPNSQGLLGKEKE